MTQKPGSSGPDPPRLLNILAVEDSPFDAELILQELQRAGLNVRMDVAKTSVELVALLLGGSYDVVLSDFGLRGWTGMDALQLLRERQSDLPFILVTGSLGDEKAAECIKLGAADFVLKDRLNRLPHAITRALEEKAQREQRLAAEEELRGSEERYRQLFESSPQPMWVYDRETLAFLAVNGAAIRGYGYSRGEFLNMTLAEIRPPEDVCRVLESAHEEPGESFEDAGEWRHRRKDGSILDAGIVSHSIEWGGRPAKLVLATNITERKRAEEALRGAERQNALILKTAGEGILGVNSEGKTTFVNPEAARLLGYAPQELVGQELHALIHHTRPDGTPYPKQECPNYAAFRDGQVHSLSDEVFWREDGTSFPVEYASTPVLDDGGRPIGAVMVFRDITDRKRAEEALAESQLRLAEVIGSAMDAIISVDEEQRITLFNSAAEKMFQWASAQMIGQPLERLIPGLLREAHSRQVRAFAREGLTRRNMGALGAAIQGLRANGQEFPIEASISRVEVKGKGILTAVLRDVTERRQAEEALRKSEENFRSLVKNAPYAIYQTSMDGDRFVSVNPALVVMLGYESEAEVLALGLATQVYRDLGARARLLPELMRHERFYNLEIEWKRKDGKPLTLRSSGRMVRNGNGERFFEAIAEDVTERRSLERQLQQAQKMEAVGRLAGGIAHDFNNLLTVIRGYAELMLEEPDREKIRRHAQNIMKASDRTAALTRQLLAFSRKQVLWPQVLDLNAVVGETKKMLPPLIGEDVLVIVIPGPKLGRVKADPGQLEQVLMNLVINARDAMPRGGKLVLETANVECDQGYCSLHPGARPGAYVMLAVSDNGCGMDMEIQSHIFEPFFTTKPKDKGTGLGLATVYGIVKQSGGHIFVYSEPGIGTTFKLYLPRVEQEPVAAPPPPRFEEQAAVTETLLVVEDEEGVRHLTRAFLEQRGYRVLEAPNGAEALEVAAAHAGPIHLLVTDIVMPGMRGRELAEKLCSLRPQIKLLYVSGYTDGSIVENGELGPGSAFLEKPFSSDALARKVRQVLSSASSGCERPAVPEAAEPAKRIGPAPAVTMERTRKL